MKTKNYKEFFIENKYVIMGFLVSAVAIIVAYIVMGIYPFGDKSVLRVDAYHQYGPFHEELRYRLVNGKSLLYSWENGLGRNFIAQIAYYTASPFAFLSVFFKQNQITEFMGFIVFLKISLAGATSAYFFKKKYGFNDLAITAFGCCFSLSAFVTAYFWNVMWMDSILFFPLIALGIESIVKGNKYKLYTISLAIALIANFYIGFIICIFITFYFIVSLLSHLSIKHDFKIIIKKCLIFGAFSILAAAIAAFILLPTFLALRETSTFSSSFPKDWKTYFDIFDYLPAHFLGVTPKVLVKNESLPNVYCGIFTILLLPFYIMNKDIQRKEKILTFGFLAIMFLGFYLNKFDYVFHGFHYPANLPHRFSFVYSFMLINISYKTFRTIKKIDITIFLYIIVAASIFLVANEKIFASDDRVAVLKDIFLALNVFVMAIYGGMFFMRHKIEFLNKNFIMCISTVLILELIASTGIAMGMQGGAARNNYKKVLNSGSEITEFLNANQEDHQRAEFYGPMTTNDGSLLHLNSFSQFSSTANGATCKIIEQLGMAATSNSYRYFDPPPFLNALFSMKYIFHSGDVINNNSLELVGPVGEYYVFENKYTLPIAFYVNSEVKDWDSTSTNPFVVQNNFVEAATGRPSNMYQGYKMQKMESENITLTKKTEGVSYTYTVNEPRKLDNIPSMTFFFEVEKTGPVYAYVHSPNSTEIKVKAGEREFRKTLNTTRSVLYMGECTKGDIIELKAELTRKGSDELGYRQSATVRIYMVEYNHDGFLRAFDDLSKNPLNIDTFEDDHIIGWVDAPKDGLIFTSIPYDKGFNVTVNGEKLEDQQIQNGGFLAIDVKAGMNNIEVTYSPQGFKTAVLITFSGIILLALCMRFLQFKADEAYAPPVADITEDFEYAACEDTSCDITHDGDIDEL